MYIYADIYYIYIYIFSRSNIDFWYETTFVIFLFTNAYVFPYPYNPSQWSCDKTICSLLILFMAFVQQQNNTYLYMECMWYLSMLPKSLRLISWVVRQFYVCPNDSVVSLKGMGKYSLGYNNNYNGNKIIWNILLIQCYLLSQLLALLMTGLQTFYQYLYFSRFSGLRVINIKHSAMCQHCFYDALIAH